MHDNQDLDCIYAASLRGKQPALVSTHPAASCVKHHLNVLPVSKTDLDRNLALFVVSASCATCVMHHLNVLPVSKTDLDCWPC